MQEFKYTTLIHSITQKISSGRWPQGEAIPAERKLAELFSVSRITVQRSLDELIRHEILIRKKGKKGYFVQDKKDIASDTESGLIGVAIDDGTNIFDTQMLQGIEEQLWEEKKHTILCGTNRDFHKVHEYFQSLTRRNLDGVIFSPLIDCAGNDEANQTILALLHEHHIPVVLVDRTVKGRYESLVSSDHKKSTYDLTKKILEQGHKKLMLVRGCQCSSMIEKLEGFYDALEESGISRTDVRSLAVDDTIILPGGTLDENILEQINAELGTDPDATALVALNSRVMKGACTALVRRGYPLSRFLTGTLQGQYATGLAQTDRAFVSVQHKYRLGQEAARLLLRLVQDAEHPHMHILIDTELEEISTTET